MKQAAKLLDIAHARGIRTNLDGDGRLRLQAPPGKITPKMEHLLRRYRTEIVEILSQSPQCLDNPSRTKERGSLKSKTPSLDRGRNRSSGPQKDEKGLREESKSSAQDNCPRRAPSNLHKTARQSLPTTDKTSRIPVFSGVLSVSPSENEQFSYSIWNGQRLSGALIALDSETHPIQSHQVPKLVLAQVSDDRDHYILPRERLAEFLRLHRDHEFVAHNASFDWNVVLQWLQSDHDTQTEQIWWDIADGRLHDTQLLWPLVRLAEFDGRPQQPGLDELCEKLLNLSLPGKDDPRRMQFHTIEGQELSSVDPWFLEYAMRDAIVTIRLFCHLEKRAEKLQPRPNKLLPNARERFGLLSETIQVRASIPLNYMHRTGMHIDRDRVGPAVAELEWDLQETAEEVDRLTPESSEPVVKRYKIKAKRGNLMVSPVTGVPKMADDVIRSILAAFAKDNQIDPPPTDAGKLSLKKDFWKDYENDFPFLAAVNKLKAKGKLLGFFRHLDAGRIHPKYSTLVRTGRTSSREPNVQNLPRSGGVREMFVPTPGYKWFTIDYSQLELRTLAAICLFKDGKSALADLFAQGADVHTATAAAMLGIPTEQLAARIADGDPAAIESRRQAKAITFGVPGGLSAATLVTYAKQTYRVNLSLEQATSFRDRLINELYPELGRYLDEESERVWTLTGRVRNKVAYTVHKNTPFQGLAADGAKLAMFALLRAGYRLINFVHDEFIIELPDDCDLTVAAEDIEGICCRSMQELTGSVPIKCDYALADRWSKDAKAVFDENGRLQVWRPDSDTPDVPPGPAEPQPTPDPVESSCKPEPMDSQPTADVTERPCTPDPVESQPLLDGLLRGEQPWHLGLGDCIDLMDAMPPNSVDLVFGSPPYAEKGERYIDGAKKWKTDDWVDWMCKVTLSALRITKGFVFFVANGSVRKSRYLPACELLLARLYAQGVICERPCIFYKNAPPNRRDYFGNDWEYVLAFKTLEKVSYFGWEAIAEPPKYTAGGRFRQRATKGNRRLGSEYPQNKLARPRDVIRVTVGGGHMGSELAHDNEAPFPEKLAKYFILPFCPPGGIVLDPFSGSGTTGAVAVKNERRYIGFDIRESQIDLSQRRLEEAQVSQQEREASSPQAGEEQQHDRDPNKSSPGGANTEAAVPLP